MTDIQVLKKFASAVIDFAGQAHALAGMVDNYRKMHKQASAKPAFNTEKMQKAASAVASLYGDRAAVSPDMLMRVWGKNPNALVDSLVKVASDAVANKVREPGMVTVKKTAKAEEAPKRIDHRTAFDMAFDL